MEKCGGVFGRIAQYKVQREEVLIRAALRYDTRYFSTKLKIGQYKVINKIVKVLDEDGILFQYHIPSFP